MGWALSIPWSMAFTRRPRWPAFATRRASSCANGPTRFPGTWLWCTMPPGRRAWVGAGVVRWPEPLPAKPAALQNAIALAVVLGLAGLHFVPGSTSIYRRGGGLGGAAHNLRGGARSGARRGGGGGAGGGG